MAHRNVFITGGTGYIGRRLITTLVARGAYVRAMVRAGSEGKVPAGAMGVVGDVLSRASISAGLPRDSVVVQLVGTTRPSPTKSAQFEALDFASARECIAAAKAASVKHVVYVSVANPAPIMRAYVGVRVRIEALLRDSGIPHTIIRPWYVLGPGHRWPCLLYPMYLVLGAIPSTSDGARRLGLVTLRQMIGTLTWAIETAGAESRVVEVPEIRRIGDEYAIGSASGPPPSSPTSTTA
ncbi:MAG TPA: NAD(P)H-binding protein [Gemmatimonadaceae bacterium]|jgi:uncharacterized protein YbjT (DUF2867 family)|nr:NAD(P)H-binding protein [Gemmatimonadaceae bacterium]